MPDDERDKLTPAEAQQQARALAAQIEAKVATFEVLTGCRIVQIRIVRDAGQRIYSVQCDVWLQ